MLVFSYRLCYSWVLASFIINDFKVSIFYCQDFIDVLYWFCFLQKFEAVRLRETQRVHSLESLFVLNKESVSESHNIIGEIRKLSETFWLFYAFGIVEWKAKLIVFVKAVGPHDISVRVLKSLVDDIKDIGTQQLFLILDNNYDSIFGAFSACIEKGPICVSL